MRIRDFVLLGLLMLWLAAALVFWWKKRKNGHCLGCDACSQEKCEHCTKK